MLLAPVLALALAGCSDAPGEEAAGPPPNPLLYEIASADGAVEGWMLGTIHALGTLGRFVTDVFRAICVGASLTARGPLRTLTTLGAFTSFASGTTFAALATRTTVATTTALTRFALATNNSTGTRGHHVG